MEEKYLKGTAESNPKVELSTGEGRKRERDDLEDLEEREVSDIGSSHNSLKTLSLGDFVEEACQLSQASADDAHPLWKSTTWEFARFLRTRKELAGLKARKVVEKIPWQRTDFGEDEILMFMNEWNMVKVPAGQSPLNTAFAMAQQKPLVANTRFRRYGLFIGVCGWLQKLVGDEDIYLPIDSLAKLLGVSTSIVSNYRKLACDEGFLVLVAKHTAHRATRFKFNLETFPEVRDYNV